MSDNDEVKLGHMQAYRDGDQVVVVFDGEVGVGPDIPSAFLAAVQKTHPDVKEVKLGPQAAMQMPDISKLPQFPKDYGDA